MAEKVDPRSIDNPLPVRIALSASRPRFVYPFHIQGNSYHNAETNPVYLVSTLAAGILDSLSIRAAGNWKSLEKAKPDW
jgi:hypothetical protein